MATCSVWTVTCFTCYRLLAIRTAMLYGTYHHCLPHPTLWMGKTEIEWLAEKATLWDHGRGEFWTKEVPICISASWWLCYPGSQWLWAAHTHRRWTYQFMEHENLLILKNPIMKKFKVNEQHVPELTKKTFFIHYDRVVLRCFRQAEKFASVTKKERKEFS